MKEELQAEMLEKVMYLASIGWGDKELASYLGLTSDEYATSIALNDDLGKAVSRGRLTKRAEIEIAVARAAEKGDVSSIKEYRDIVRDKKFSVSKLDLFGGSKDPGAFQRIQDYIASGSKGSLSDNEQIYIDILTLIYSLDGQYGKRRTIKFLTSPPFSFGYSHASDMYSEAVEMFYCNRKISKEALRAKMADEFDTLYIAARNAAQTTKDYEIASGILANKARALQLDKEDPQKLPPEMYPRPFRLLSLDPEAVGLPAVNRQELARQIDGIVAPESVKRRLKMEAGITSMDIQDIIENGIPEESQD